MGIIVLPDKDDYWTTNPIIPEHHICNEMGMNRDRFRFIWRHIHFKTSDGNDDEETDDEESDDLPQNRIVREKMRKWTMTMKNT